MSKGFGRVERLILEQLDADSIAVGRTVPELRAAMPETAEPSLRRALASLKRKQLVEHKQDTGRQIHDRWVSVAVATEHAKWKREERRREKRRETHMDALLDREINWRAEQLAAQRRREADPAAGTLAKVLGMMGSAHDGEVLSAALKAEDARKKSGKTWQELLGLG
jgi:hypothetical protein